jgi:hypothetical protein
MGGSIYAERILRRSFKGFRSEMHPSRQDYRIWPPRHLLKLAILPDRQRSGTNYSSSCGHHCSKLFLRQLETLFLSFIPTGWTLITYKAQKLQSGQVEGVASYLIRYSMARRRDSEYFVKILRDRLSCNRWGSNPVFSHNHQLYSIFMLRVTSYITTAIGGSSAI